MKRGNNYFVIKLEKNGYEPFIDYLKGISILFVVLTHCLPKLDYMLFSLWGAQAVPLFLLIQTWHVCRKADKTVKKPQFITLFNRILKLFIILLSVELFLLIVVFHHDPALTVKSAIIEGGIGPGCYFVWIYIQLAFIIPVIVRKLELLKSVMGGVEYA